MAGPTSACPYSFWRSPDSVVYDCPGTFHLYVVLGVASLTAVLGISAFYHDSSAALVVDGELVVAIQEERLTRIKQDSSFPLGAIRKIFDIAGIGPLDVDFVAFYEKPLLKFDRILETYLAVAPRGFRSFSHAMPIWLGGKLFQRTEMLNLLSGVGGDKRHWDSKLIFFEHHMSHAASAFFPSPFAEATVVTVDGVGEWATTAIGEGRGTELNLLSEIHFPHSLGLLYSAFTEYCGFRVNSGEYKLMGLAPYGEPIYAEIIKSKLVKLHEDGSFQLDLSYFSYLTALTMTSVKFHELFGRKPRDPGSDPQRLDMDLAASIQSVTDEIMASLVGAAIKATGIPDVCLAGGVALNCVSNSKLRRLVPELRHLWIQPAAGDAGGSVGAAFAGYFHNDSGAVRKVERPDGMKSSYLGSEYSDTEACSLLSSVGARWSQVSDKALQKTVVDALEEGQAVGWFQGRMEFGPRALGNRSILADPRSAETQKSLNLKTKFRESFRPFAPSVLEEESSSWFDLPEDSRYMMFIGEVKEEHLVSHPSSVVSGLDKVNEVRSTIPAVTHLDNSARVQTVSRDSNPRFYGVIREFFERTGTPMVVNTSFNVRGEPIVESPIDAYRCFMGTNLDLLVIGNLVFRKHEQPAENRVEDYREGFALD